MFEAVAKAFDTICSLVRRFHCFGHSPVVHEHLVEQGIGVYRNTVIGPDWEYSLQEPEYWKPTLRIECVQVE